MTGARRRNAAALAGLGAVLVLAACFFQQSAPVTPRPAAWAEHVPSGSLKNWYRLDDDVYRSEQPSRAAFEEIRDHGIKTVLNLRSGHTDESKAAGLGLALVWVPMTAGGFKEADVVAALKAIRDAPKPVLLHCQRGADRSGLVSAMYRIVFQGWTREEAVAELLGGGFGFHTRYRNIPKFLHEVDVERIRKELRFP